MSARLSILKNIQKEIDIAKKEAKRENESIALIAVSKNFNEEAIIPFLEEGQRSFGENRVQEACAKYKNLKKIYTDIELHLIGPLQSNKVKEAVEFFDVIQTIDREKIAVLLAKEMEKQQKPIPCFIQVNIGLEPQKSGVFPEKTKDFVEKCKKDYGLLIKGLMAIPPAQKNPEGYFSALKRLKEDCHLEKLSMGMSNDFATAIHYGSDMVRIGSKLFGARKHL